eukprot:Lankesteria_metandrocarpae@DN1680_c0_g1_i1.p1
MRSSRADLQRSALAAVAVESWQVATRKFASLLLRPILHSFCGVLVGLDDDAWRRFFLHIFRSWQYASRSQSIIPPMPPSTVMNYFSVDTLPEKLLYFSLWCELLRFVRGFTASTDSASSGDPLKDHGDISSSFADEEIECDQVGIYARIQLLRIRAIRHTCALYCLQWI